MVKPGSDPAEVSRVIDQVVEKFLDKGPTKAEIARVRTSINASLVRGLEQIGGFNGKAVTLARHAIECFGPERCMFESNFPVDKQSCSYHVLYNAFKKMVADASEADKAALFHDTAHHAYRLA